MKANAPERIWIDPANDLPKLSGHIGKDSVEYIRADVLFKRAKEWFLVSGIDSFCEDFLNYISYER